jgi:two-component system, OmpR family, sensor kinase
VALSLRTRLTVWYSALLLLAIAVFTATVLWLQWTLLVRQSDESLDTLSAAAVNVVESELSETGDLLGAAREMESVVRRPDYMVAVFDADGATVRRTGIALPIALPVFAERHQVVTATVRAADHHRWRVTLRSGDMNGHRFAVALAAPLEGLETQWGALVEACAIGIPFVLTLAIGGGWLLGRRGLRPLAQMATEARDITAQTANARLAVPGVGAELDDVAASFNRVLDRLGSALSTQRRFMADASHELRTPVSIMRTAADVTLSQTVRDDAEYRDALAVVSQQSSRLARLVDDMLVLARADAGGYPMVPAEVDLDAVVADCVRELAPRAAAKEIRVASRLEPISVTADEALLRRMFGNLLANAVIYTPRGGAIEVTMAQRPGVVAVHIADTGPGIAPADRERVFERFVRLDPARGEGGAGLGLSIARWVAEVHGGHVDLLSSGPGGSVFSATIPA